MKCWSEKWGTGTGLTIGGKWPVTPECVPGKTARPSGAFKGPSTSTAGPSPGAPLSDRCQRARVRRVWVSDPRELEPVAPGDRQGGSDEGKIGRASCRERVEI